MLRSVTIGFIDSARAGMCNAPKVVRDYEETTGCKPQYVVAGFSQDALGEAPRGDEAFEGGNHRQSTAQVSWAVERAALPAGKRVEHCLDGGIRV